MESKNTSEARILIVEDATDTRVMLGRFLAQRGYGTVLAASGKEALEALEWDPSIALVLLDIMMPDAGGVEILKEIMQRQHKPVVVMVSAINDQEVARRASELGAFDYLLKPIDLDALESTIVAGLGHAEYGHQSWWKRLG